MVQQEHRPLLTNIFEMCLKYVEITRQSCQWTCFFMFFSVCNTCHLTYAMDLWGEHWWTQYHQKMSHIMSDPCIHHILRILTGWLFTSIPTISRLWSSHTLKCWFPNLEAPQPAKMVLGYPHFRKPRNTMTNVKPLLELKPETSFVHQWTEAASAMERVLHCRAQGSQWGFRNQSALYELSWVHNLINLAIYLLHILSPIYLHTWHNPEDWVSQGLPGSWL